MCLFKNSCIFSIKILAIATQKNTVKNFKEFSYITVPFAVTNWTSTLKDKNTITATHFYSKKWLNDLLLLG